MSSKEQEYQEIFYSEAIDNFSEIERLLTVLEKNSQDKVAIQSLFRITHTLKGNATGMGYEKIADLAHVMEDFFGEVNKGSIMLNSDIFAIVFKATDALGALINSIKTSVPVKYLGIKTKLEVLIKNLSRIEVGKGEETESDSKNQTDFQYDEDIDPESNLNWEGEGNLQEEEEEEVVENEEALQKENLSFSDLVQVHVKKLDNLLNLVGELVIERDRLLTLYNGVGSRSEFSRLNRISSDLQYSVMDVRLVQIGFLFNKFHRIVRDAGYKESKKVNLLLEGTDTEIDRNILQVISDSLIHLIRNGVSHGIETPEERLAKGKKEEGTITLSASSESDNVRIVISDDGAGINFEKVKQKAVRNGIISLEEANHLSNKDLSLLIFEPGFSTADEVSSLSGRGVGMDVVKKALDSIGGTIIVESDPQSGTRFELVLPASMAVKSTLLFGLKNEVYAIPLTFTEAVMSIKKSDIFRVGNSQVTTYLGKTIPLIYIKDLFDNEDGENIQCQENQLKIEIVVVSFNGKKLGVIVDKLLQQKEIIEKPLKKPYDKTSLISGLTILGNGNVCLVLSIPGLIKSIGKNQFAKSIASE
jgi:two-component system, chemotaxis family, sensor kinase CheA